jgi:hypothetical protein
MSKVPSDISDIFVRLNEEPAPTPPPRTINDVPVPVRITIVTLARKGMPAAEIAARFDLPVTWVILLVECPPGSTEH